MKLRTQASLKSEDYVDFIQVCEDGPYGTGEIPVVPLFHPTDHYTSIMSAALLHAVRRIDRLETKLEELRNDSTAT